MLQHSRAMYSISCISWLQLAAEYGGCSQLILMYPFKCCRLLQTATTCCSCSHLNVHINPNPSIPPPTFQSFKTPEAKSQYFSCEHNIDGPTTPFQIPKLTFFQGQITIPNQTNPFIADPMGVWVSLMELPARLASQYPLPRVKGGNRRMKPNSKTIIRKICMGEYCLHPIRMSYQTIN